MYSTFHADLRILAQPDRTLVLQIERDLLARGIFTSCALLRAQDSTLHSAVQRSGENRFAGVIGTEPIALVVLHRVRALKPRAVRPRRASRSGPRDQAIVLGPGAVRSHLRCSRNPTEVSGVDTNREMTVQEGEILARP